MNTAYALFDKTAQKITFKYPVEVTNTITLSNVTANNISATNVTANITATNVAVPLGSATVPTITFQGDTNNGIFSPAADNFAITTAGVERVRVLADGKVGIAKAAPVQALDVTGSIQASTQYLAPLGSITAPAYSFTGDTNNGIFSPAADNFAITTAGVERVRVLADGKVGIGLAAPTQALDVSGTVKATEFSGGGVGITFPTAQVGAGLTNRYLDIGAIRIQWGEKTVGDITDDSPDINITFPVAFTALGNVQITYTYVSFSPTPNISTISCAIYNQTTTGCTVRFDALAGDGQQNIGFYWLAIGLK